MKGIKDTTVYLANYYGDKILRVDSVRINHDGAWVLSRSKVQKEGLYLFYLNDKNYFEFLIGNDQQFSIEADFASSPQNKYSGADETVAFHEYQQFLSQQKAKQSAIQTRLSAIQDKKDSVKILQKKLNDLNTTMETYWKETAKEIQRHFPGRFFPFDAPSLFQTNSLYLPM